MAPPKDPALPKIAIIGLGCVLPDAPNVEAFWQNILAGRCSIREVPRSRWDPDVYYSADRREVDKTYSKIGSFVEGFHSDWKKFRIPPNVLQAIDPSQLWALEATDQALKDAGYDRRPFDRSRCAVILGNSGGGEQRVDNSLRIYWHRVRASILSSAFVQDLPVEDRDRILREVEAEFKRGLPDVTEDSLPGELSNIVAGRIANVFDLGGKNFTIDAACASSAAAIEAAMHALASGQADLVLTGGVDRFQEPSLYTKFSRVGALSASGSWPFDARADGFVMGEGGAVFVLKRLQDAERDGDRVHATIAGIGTSSDGRGRGITAPRLEGQAHALRAALDSAQVTAADIDLVECHGTGTIVGDATELRALWHVYGPQLPTGRTIPIGSVKSNIGHLKSASGAAGLLKALLALHHKVLPPSIGYETPNLVLREPGIPFAVNTQTRGWPQPNPPRPRRVALSSFGFGGINYHIILEEPGPAERAKEPPATRTGVQVPVPTSPADEVAARLRDWVQTLQATAPLDTETPLPVDAFQRAALLARIRREFQIDRSRSAPFDDELSLASLIRFILLHRDSAPTPEDANPFVS